MKKTKSSLKPLAGRVALPPHLLTKFTEKRVVDFAWSPDGTRLAITGGTSLADIVLIKG